MRWIGVVLFFLVLSTTLAEPDPKKYKPEVKPKEKEFDTSLTAEDKKFLREVEAKFGIKSDAPQVDDSKSSEDEEDSKSTLLPQIKAPFPAVIAIEIVNDTDSKSKGKRTIDANLGYGYKTNSGYTYTYFGKQPQEKGKFMIYPYSQQDIPPAQSSSHQGYSQQSGTQSHISPNVEITPSQAFELVPSKEEQTAYHYDKPSVEFKTKYENVHGVETPPPPYPGGEHSSQQPSPPQTLYTTYNGHQFSSLSGQFPSVMPNYLVDTSQLLQSPQYQTAGITQDHLRTHGAHMEQRVVPVLVLRVPSSYLKNPTAELYSNTQQNYPTSEYLKNVNLQELVNQYFKKIGYSFAPQVMSYQNSLLSHEGTPPASSSIPNYEPQQYASPYVRPSYTHADYSGVQYSAVQPVMAKYPSSYSRPQYYVTRGQSLYHRQPTPQQQYVYRYRYLSQPAPVVQSPSYYVQPQYQYQQQAYQVSSQEPQAEYTAEQQTSLHDAAAQGYATPQHSHSEESEPAAVEYETPQTQNAPEYEQTHQVTTNYETSTPDYEHQQVDHTAADYGPTKVPIPVNGDAHDVQYETPAQKETVAVFSRGQTGHQHNIHPDSGATQTYTYQKLINENSGSESLVLSENYPSKDHTIATVLPMSYKTRKQNEPVQAVSYVTPLPHTMKYHSQYRVMVPQTVFKTPTSEKVSYVNSHSIPSGYSQTSYQYNPEQEYTGGSHYIPPISKQKAPLYPRNYHSHPKRMTKPESKSDTVSSPSKKPNE